jgi:hypothetical protein
MTLDQPADDELEISIFGPGYGEALALHVGQGDWILVDSCLQDGQPAGLAYLRAIGVDPQQVKVVVATHWHDDHVRGLAEIVRECVCARVGLSAAVSNREFLVLARQRLPATGLSSGTREMCEIVDVLEQRKLAGEPGAAPERLGERTIVHRSAHCEVVSLSPSAASVDVAMASFAQMTPHRRQEHRRIAAPSPNAASVALWIAGPIAKALLGADLEVEAREDRGWSAVLTVAAALQLGASDGEKGGLIKISHHGSVSGHADRVWAELLERQPAALLTPYARGNQMLPTESDRARLCQLAPYAVIVGDIRAKLPRYPSAVERMLNESTVSRRSAIGRVGHARARSRPQDGGVWRVDRIANAIALCQAA